MIITLSPVRSDETLTVAKQGDVLTLNGEVFDFGPLPEGATLPAGAIDNGWFVGAVERVSGELRLTLRLPHGPDASEAARFPQPLHILADGPVELPQ